MDIGAAAHGDAFALSAGVKLIAAEHRLHKGRVARRVVRRAHITQKIESGLAEALLRDAAAVFLRRAEGGAAVEAALAALLRQPEKTEREGQRPGNLVRHGDPQGLARPVAVGQQLSQRAERFRGSALRQRKRVQQGDQGGDAVAPLVRGRGVGSQAAHGDVYAARRLRHRQGHVQLHRQRRADSFRFCLRHAQHDGGGVRREDIDAVAAFQAADPGQNARRGPAAAEGAHEAALFRVDHRKVCVRRKGARSALFPLIVVADIP